MCKTTGFTRGLKAGLEGNTGLVSEQGCLLSPGLGLGPTSERQIRVLVRSPHPKAAELRVCYYSTSGVAVGNLSCLL